MKMPAKRLLYNYIDIIHLDRPKTGILTFKKNGISCLYNINKKFVQKIISRDHLRQNQKNQTYGEVNQNQVF